MSQRTVELCDAIKRSDLTELKALANPPRLVLESIGTAASFATNDKKYMTSWLECRKVLGNPTQFGASLKSCIRGPLTAFQKKILAEKVFDYGELRRVSAACAAVALFFEQLRDLHGIRPKHATLAGTSVSIEAAAAPFEPSDPQAWQKLTTAI